MSREVQVRFCESRGVRFPPATHLVVMVSGHAGHAEALREEVAGVLAPIGLRLSRRRPVSSTSTRASISSASTSVGDGNEEHEAVRLHHPVQEGRAGGQGQGAVQDAQVDPAFESGRADYQPEPDPAGMGQLLPARRVRTVFHDLDTHAWWRIVGWIRAKYQGKSRMSRKQLRRRFCDQGWRLAHEGVVFTGASSVAVTRYRYRGSRIATPWTPTPAAVT